MATAEASTEIAETGSQVPALVPTPAETIGAEDVALPRLYLGQFMSEHVQEKRVEAGSIFTALGKDDPDPEVLWTPGDDDGVKFHVLGLRKGKSISEGGELVLFDYNDPDAPPDAWVTYNYTIVLPDHDKEMPYKWLLTRTGKPSAQRINMVIVKNEAKGPAHELAFEVKTTPRENDKGKYFVPSIHHVEADADDVKVAEELLKLISTDPATEQQSSQAEPSI